MSIVDRFDTGCDLAECEHLLQFIEKAANFAICLPSDYHKDKHIPTQNRFPQLGPALLLKTNSICHIFSVESCGKATGAFPLNRNVVYVRDEFVGGSNPSDGTISTLFGFLLGCEERICHQPRLIIPGDEVVSLSSQP